MRTFLLGLATGWVIAAPVGPVSLLCFRTAMLQGFRAGLRAGAGATFADTLAATIAATGLRLLPTAGGPMWRGFSALVGGAIFFVGAHIVRNPFAKWDGRPTATRFLTPLVLTLGNPTNIAAFAAGFAWTGAAPTHSVGDTLRLLGGVFVGAAVWWSMLAAGAASLGRRVDDRTFHTVARTTGALLATFGAILATRAFITAALPG